MEPNLFPNGCIVAFPVRQFWICYVCLIFFECCKNFAIDRPAGCFVPYASNIFSDTQSPAYEGIVLQYAFSATLLVTPFT